MLEWPPWEDFNKYPHQTNDCESVRKKIAIRRDGRSPDRIAIVEFLFISQLPDMMMVTSVVYPIQNRGALTGTLKILGKFSSVRVPEPMLVHIFSISHVQINAFKEKRNIHPCRLLESFSCPDV